MDVPKKFQDEAKKVDRGLFILWDNQIERWRVKHKDDRTGLVRDVFLVENEDGTYRDLDMSVVRMLKDCVMWDLVKQFPDPKDIYLKVIAEWQRRKRADEVRHRGYVLDWNKEHRKEWAEAKKNAERGVFGVPEQYEKKIFIG